MDALAELRGETTEATLAEVETRLLTLETLVETFFILLTDLHVQSGQLKSVETFLDTLGYSVAPGRGVVGQDDDE